MNYDRGKSNFIDIHFHGEIINVILNLLVVAPTLDVIWCAMCGITIIPMRIFAINKTEAIKFSWIGEHHLGKHTNTHASTENAEKKWLHSKSSIANTNYCVIMTSISCFCTNIPRVSKMDLSFSFILVSSFGLQSLFLSYSACLAPLIYFFWRAGEARAHIHQKAISKATSREGEKNIHAYTVQSEWRHCPPSQHHRRCRHRFAVYVVCVNILFFLHFHWQNIFREFFFALFLATFSLCFGSSFFKCVP